MLLSLGVSFIRLSVKCKQRLFTNLRKIVVQLFLRERREVGEIQRLSQGNLTVTETVKSHSSRSGVCVEAKIRRETEEKN